MPEILYSRNRCLSSLTTSSGNVLTDIEGIFPMQLGILFLQSVHLVGTKKRIHSVKYTGGYANHGRFRKEKRRM